MQTRDACLTQLTTFLKKVAAVKDTKSLAPVKMKELPATLAAFNLSSNAYYQFK